jgi:hypothetical protein
MPHMHIDHDQWSVICDSLIQAGYGDIPQFKIRPETLRAALARFDPTKPLEERRNRDFVYCYDCGVAAQRNGEKKYGPMQGGQMFRCPKCRKTWIEGTGETEKVGHVEAA